MEERGTEAGSSGVQATQFEASTSGKAIPDSQPERQPQISGEGTDSRSPDSAVLQDAQHQLVLSLTKLVQNAIEKETKDLLRQIRDNSERQTILLKAALADSWCDSGQTAHIRAALSFQEPWKVSDEDLVKIKIGRNNQEVDEKNMSYPLGYLCHRFENLQAERIAMIIILGACGFKEFINDPPESIAAGVDALGDATSRGTAAARLHALGSFLESLARDCQMHLKLAHLDLRLKRGETYYRMKLRHDPILERLVSIVGRESPNEELANLMIQGWTRTLKSEPQSYLDKGWPRYHEGLEPLSIYDDSPEFGVIGVVKAPSARENESFMSMAAMADIISQTVVTAPGGLATDEALHALFYLLLFTGPWKGIYEHLRSTSRNLPEIRLRSRNRSRLELNVFTVHHTIRVLSPIEYDQDITADEGIPLSRVVGRFAGDSIQRDGMKITEKRVSIWLSTSTSITNPVFRGLCLSDSQAWCSTVLAMNHVRPGEIGQNNRGIRTCKWLGGLSIYQRTLVVVLEVWHKEWNKMLDSVDKVLNVRIEDVFDSEKRAALMFEASSGDKFESSDKYFFVIELLRISAEWIKETVTDLRHPQEKINEILQSPVLHGLINREDPARTDYTNHTSWEACANVIHHNWDVVFQDVKKYENDLLGRIERKTQEVKSLRDGLFSATSVREATKSTQINEYILVFTVMTITYLPLGFVATLYGLDIFDFQMAGQITSFAVTTVVVSLTTYLAAWGFLYDVRQRRKKNSFRDRYPNLTGWIQRTADPVKHAFGASKSTEKVTGVSSTADIVVGIHSDLPPEEQHVHEKETSHWKAILDWLMERRRGRKDRLSV